MHLVKDNLAAAQTVSPFRVVGMPLHNTLVFPPLNDLLGVVIVSAQLLFPFRVLQNIHQIQLRSLRLIFIVGTDIHVVIFYRVVGADAARTVKCNKAVLPCATPHHGKHNLPSGAVVGFPIGAVPKGNQKLLPREQLFKTEILHQSQIFFQLLCVHIDFLCLEAFSYMGGKCFLLLAGNAVFDKLNIFQNMRI